MDSKYVPKGARECSSVVEHAQKPGSVPQATHKESMLLKQNKSVITEVQT